MDIVPLAAILVTRVSTSATTSTTSTTKGAGKLAEAVQNLSIQTREIMKLQNELKELQHMKIVANTSHATEL